MACQEERSNNARTRLRQGSIADLEFDCFPKTSSYEDTVRQLDIYYGIVKRQLLRFQSPITGLFPVISIETKIGSVRDSIYCATAIWSLYQAYRRIDDDRGKSHELGQSAVKCMRGILECWIRQAARVESFKMQQCDRHALHCKFHLITGDEVFTHDEYHHLQIDVVSLYLLMLVQMITSGLQIIYTQDEVAFVQNLVYYVERAYRTPDYGHWERGSKHNDGTPEIHASSIGMAKAALEAINGCNLFGDKGASWSVIYVDIDAHNRNRSIFETLLPRESSSKGVDAALLPTISFPAFATHDEVLYCDTKSNVMRRLRGQYGFKRFGRDGYKCVLEDTNRQFYRNGEIKAFENVECEWPLFYIFMIIDGVFKTMPEQVDEFQNLLKTRIKHDECGDPVIPMYFYVPMECVEAERREPGSQERYPSEVGSGTTGVGTFLWNQALFIIAQLLTDELLHVNELDPIRRYLPSYNRPRRAGRYSAFQGTATDLVVQTVLIAESMRLQAMMATYGIQTQTPHEVEPVQIWSSKQMVTVFEQLGVNKKLGLKGRPVRPIGALGTSKVYRVCGLTVLCYPLIFEVSEFYLYRDMALLIDDIKTELQFVGRYWRLSGRPTMCLLIREEHMRDPQFKEMLDLLAMLKKGYCDGLKVRVGRLQNLISSSCIEHLDFMNTVDVDLDLVQFRQLEHEYIGYQSLTDVPKTLTYSEEMKDFSYLVGKPTYEIIEVLRATEGLHARSQLFGLLLKKEGPNYEFNDVTVRDHLQNLYTTAGSLRSWAAVRYCSSLLHHTVDSISPFITTVLVSGKQLTVGVVGQQETVFDKPMTPAEIRTVMYDTVQPYDVIGAVLQQEIVLYCGRLIATRPDMFQGILKIRVGWVLEAMKHYLRMNDKFSKPVEHHSPYEVRTLLYKVLSLREWATREKLSTLERRRIEGCLCRVPDEFYSKVWDVTVRTRRGVAVQECSLPHLPTLAAMGRSELNFALLVEQMLNHITRPEYRQIIVEVQLIIDQMNDYYVLITNDDKNESSVLQLLCIVSTILQRNPELTFQNQLHLDHLVQEAFHLFCKDNNMEKCDDMTSFYSQHYGITTGYLARAVVNNVLQGGHLATPISEDDDTNNEETCRVS